MHNAKNKGKRKLNLCKPRNGLSLPNFKRDSWQTILLIQFPSFLALTLLTACVICENFHRPEAALVLLFITTCVVSDPKRSLSDVCPF